MSDIHQKWREFRQKNGDFLCHAQNGSCSAYTQQGMQSKIAKQAAEIKRLTEENERLSSKNDELSGQNAAQKVNIACAMEMWHNREKEVGELKKALDTSLSFAEIKRLTEENKQLHRALDIAAKNADTNFERGKIKGMKKIWKELVDCYNGRSINENNKIFGYHTVGGILMNLSPTWFINKAEEYHKQEEKKEQQVKDIQIGDEVEIFDTSCPDDNPHSDIGIVVIIDSENHSYVVVGPNFEGCFDETDIQSGTVKKTGKHFDSIPLDYFN